ncbi:MAG: hypothetical protein PHW92_02975 [Lutibacter sp.]|nr:hypothetical protein [Lutibacter sp.]
MNKPIFINVVLALLTVFSYAQEITVKGKVIDWEIIKLHILIL